MNGEYLQFTCTCQRKCEQKIKFKKISFRIIVERAASKWTKPFWSHNTWPRFAYFPCRYEATGEKTITKAEESSFALLSSYKNKGNERGIPWVFMLGYGHWKRKKTIAKCVGVTGLAARAKTAPIGTINCRERMIVLGMTSEENSLMLRMKSF